MRRRLLLSYLSITVFVLLVLEVPLGVAYANAQRARLLADVQHDALALSIRSEEALENDDTTALELLVKSYQADTGGRVVVVDRNGLLLADSDPLPGSSGPRDFANRPELALALSGKEASGTRSSRTLGTDLLYVAVPVVNGNKVMGALRVTYPTSFVDRKIRRSWLVLVGVALVVLGLVFLVSLWLARSITRPLSELEDAAERLGAGDLDARAPDSAGPSEIRVLAASFNSTAQRLQSLLTSQQAFVADASHQLRSPLHALRLRLENLEDELAAGGGDDGIVDGRGPDGSVVGAGRRAPDLAAAGDDVHGALAEVARLSRLVDGLLALARAERGDSAPEDLDVEALVAMRVDAWTALAAERGVALVAEVSEGTRARITPGHMEQALDNLLSNAIEHAPRGSAVRVAGGSARGMTTVSVVDNGPGLTAEQRARAFDRFWRPAGAPTGGSGLGLAIVRRLVEADGGTVHLDEAPGGGLVAVIRVPAAVGAHRS